MKGTVGKMKTLDEVIDALERCSKPQFDCAGCPYEDDEAETGCHPEDRDADMLYYLKAYKEMVYGVVNVICQYKETFKKIIEDCENENAR